MKLQGKKVKGERKEEKLVRKCIKKKFFLGFKLSLRVEGGVRNAQYIPLERLPSFLCIFFLW